MERPAPEIRCQACDEENQAVCRCMECDYFFCQECLQAHGRLAVMRSHRIYMLALSRTADMNNPRTEPPKCEQHPEKNLSIYCTTCDLLVCAVCALQYHGRHSRCGLARAVAECKQSVAELTKIAEGSVRDLSVAMTEMDKVLKSLDNQFDNAKTKLSTTADQMVAKVIDAGANLRQAVEDIYQQKAQMIQDAQAVNSKELSQAQNKLQEVNQQMSEATDFEILNLKRTLLETLRELISTWKEPERVPEGLIEDFSISVTSLGGWSMHTNEVRLPGPEHQHPNEEPPTSTSPPLNWNESQKEEPPSLPPRTIGTFAEHEEVPQRPPGPPPAETSQTPTGRPLNQDPEGHERLPSHEGPQGPISPENITLQQEQQRPTESPQREEQWQLVKSIKKFGPAKTEFKCAFAVAAFASGDFVVADTAKRQLVKIAKVSKSKSHIISNTLATKSFVYAPTYVAVNKDDQVIVLMAPVVKVFDKDFRFIRQFLPGMAESDSTPTCLAVDDDNLIAVGFAEKEEIALHSPDGSLIKTLPARHISTYLSILQKEFVYTNWTRRKIVSVDYNSNLIFNQNLIDRSKTGPTGVCFCPDGSFYVAVVGQNAPGNIYHSSLNNTNLGRVITECGHPYCITMNPNGNQLMVAAGKAVHIYHLVPNKRKP